MKGLVVIWNEKKSKALTFWKANRSEIKGNIVGEAISTFAQSPLSTRRVIRLSRSCAGVFLSKTSLN